MKQKIKKFVDKLQQAWNKLLYKLMFKKYKLNTGLKNMMMSIRLFGRTRKYMPNSIVLPAILILKRVLMKIPICVFQIECDGINLQKQPMPFDGDKEVVLDMISQPLHPGCRGYGIIN